MGSRLINVARRMQVNARHKGESDRLTVNHTLNTKTMEACCKPAGNTTKKLRNVPEQAGTVIPALNADGEWQPCG